MTTAYRTSRSYHRNRIATAYASHEAALQAREGLDLALAANPNLANNCYWTDIVERADNLVGEMEEDIDASITAALVDGFGPEDFE